MSWNVNRKLIVETNKHGKSQKNREEYIPPTCKTFATEKWTWLSIVVIKKVKNMLQMSHHSKLTCLCISLD